MNCPSCCAENADNADFCAKCGAKVRSAGAETTPGLLAEQVGKLCREVRSEKSLDCLLVGDEIPEKTRGKILACLRKAGVGQPSEIWAFLPFVTGSKRKRIPSKKCGLLISENGLFTVNPTPRGSGFLSWADFSRTERSTERKKAPGFVLKRVQFQGLSVNQLFGEFQNVVPLVPLKSPLGLFVAVGFAADEPAVRGFVEKLRDLVLATGIPAEGSRPSVGERPNSWALLGTGCAIPGAIAVLVALFLGTARGYFAGGLVALLCFTPLVLSFRIKALLKSGENERARRLSRIIRNVLLGALVIFTVVAFVGDKVEFFSRFVAPFFRR